MYRRSLAVLLGLLLGIGLMTPVSTRAQTPLVPVVLIHGQGGSPDLTWTTAIAYLQTRGYRLGETLFAVDLSETKAAYRRLGLLDDTGLVLAEVRRVLARTGAEKVDLIGHSRGGLIARLIATGDTMSLVRRVVTLNAPHEGALTAEQLKQMLASAGVTLKRPSEVTVPEDLRADSMALQSVAARTRRYGDRTVPVLAIAATWREGLPAELAGHDGAVTVQSQLAWPGARTAIFRLGPTADELQAILRSDLAAGLLVLKSPHLQSLESTEVLDRVADFLLAKKMAPAPRPCDPTCGDWSDLTGHWAASELRPMLSDLVPYELGERGERVFSPERPMNRAEFIAGLAGAMGLEERFRAPARADLEGHWAAFWIEAAVDAKLIGAGAKAFGPDDPMTRAEAAALVVRAKGLPPGAVPGRFADAAGHRYEAEIETLAGLQWMSGEKGAFRPDEPLTMAEGAVLLVRAFR